MTKYEFLISEKSFYTSALLSFIKSLMLISAIKDIEFISNLYKPGKMKLEFRKNEFFFFTNISLFYTVFCIFTGYLKTKISLFNEIYLFSLITAFILELLVVFMFWPLFFIDPSLVKARIPKNKNKLKMCFDEFPKHLFPLLVLLIEIQGINIEKRSSHKLFFIVFSTIYFLISEALIVYDDIYLYPLFRKLNTVGRGILFFLVLVISILVYEISIFAIPFISNWIVSKSS